MQYKYTYMYYRGGRSSVWNLYKWDYLSAIKVPSVLFSSYPLLILI